MLQYRTDTLDLGLVRLTLRKAMMSGRGMERDMLSAVSSASTRALSP